GDRYLSDLREMAAKTPMEYSDLTGMSRNLATGFKDDPARMLGLMESIGNAGSAVGVDPAGMGMMATAMSRMQSSGKVTLEYLNLIQERGVDAVGMLSEGLGKTKGEIYEMISKGKIGGVEAVDTIQAAMDRLYGGAMDRQSRTFSGLASTLSDAEKEMQNAYGEGYNKERGAGLTAQTDWLSGASGTAQQEANAAVGAWQASLENAKEGYLREAAESAMASTEYQTAKARGDAAEMGRLMMEAKVAGMHRYNASEGAQLALESDLALAGAIREDAATNEAYWDAGKRKGEEYTKGLASVLSDGQKAYRSAVIAGFADEDYGVGPITPLTGGKQVPGHAGGLGRVPYDNYLALLHEGERVQTAREVRGEGAGGGVAITITGCDWSIREDADVDRIAGALAEAIGLKVMAGR
ncbi:MAG: tape measure protein, partial [Pseudoflavonifractor sp.]